MKSQNRGTRNNHLFHPDEKHHFTVGTATRVSGTYKIGAMKPEVDLDEIAIWNKKLTSSEVANLYKKEK